MCEPSHSIIQFDQQDDQGNPNEPKIKGGLITKICKWLHISKFGFGHSEAFNAKCSALSRLPYSSYEGHWWNRGFSIDGNQHMAVFDREEAAESAKIYYDRVCNGDLRTLRRFLENSLKQTVRPEVYVIHARDMLNVKGREEYDRKRKIIASESTRIDNVLRDRLTKMIIGFTRKRHLLIPEWADDNRLWTPGQGDAVAAS